MDRPEDMRGGYNGRARNWLNLRQVAYLAAVVEERSFTRAAARLHIAQPSLSQQVKALEGAVGATLVQRSSTRGVELTPAGRVFFGEARTALAAAENAVRRARAVADMSDGRLHVATVSSLATWVLPRAVATWRPLHPGVALRITEHQEVQALVDFMHAGGADLAVGPRPPGWNGKIRWLGNQRWVLIVPAGHRYAGASGVDIAEFANDDWVLYSPGHGLHKVVLDMCAAAGFIPNVVVETRQVDAAARLAAAGLGAAMVPRNAIPEDLRRAHRVDIANPPVYEVVAYVRGEFVPPASSFVQMLATLDIGLDRPLPQDAD
jgi:DNA-binding transcriptional LysR family regulator